MLLYLVLLRTFACRQGGSSNPSREKLNAARILRCLLLRDFRQVQVMPACMNRLGDMTRLVSLKLSQNKLRSLPSR